MALPLRGALIEYGSDFLGPLPNVVVFQFNPASLSRTVQVPPRPAGGAARETSQAGEPPTERISFKAEFDASDDLNRNFFLARAAGVGPQLAALEKMVHPSNKLGGLLGAALDVIGNALGLGGGEKPPTQPIPREKYPRLLFLWGLTRILPVVIDSLAITELQYDALLNPTHAEVQLGLTVTPPDPCVEDVVAKGAYEYTTTAQEALAAANLINAAKLIVEMIPF